MEIPDRKRGDPRYWAQPLPLANVWRGSVLNPGEATAVAHPPRSPRLFPSTHTHPPRAALARAGRPRTPLVPAWLCAAVSILSSPALLATAAPPSEAVVELFQRDVQPIIERYCYDCHGNGMDKGGVELDGLDTPEALTDPKLWTRVLRNVRSGIMPTSDAVERLPAAEAEKMMAWTKHSALGLDPAKPDPGRVVVRRLNRVEYRNTIRDLLGVDFDTEKEFPADDTGHGFDNIGEVLNISPMLLEKYLDAAQQIVSQAVPTRLRVPREEFHSGATLSTLRVESNHVALPAQPAAGGGGLPQRPVPTKAGAALELSYYTPATVGFQHEVPKAGAYQVEFKLHASERYVDNVFDLNRCRLILRDGDEVLMEQEFVREGGKLFTFVFDRNWDAGGRELTAEIVPLAPAEPQVRQLKLRLQSVTVRGPMAEADWVKPAHYARYFPQEPPADPAARRQYARDLLARFAHRAFRRPPEPESLDRLAALAESVYRESGHTFEAGVAQAMAAVLASPNFIFRREGAAPVRDGEAYVEIDDYALASRLSYFFWSTMPDEELFRLAAAGQLRAQLAQQIDRLFNSPRASEFFRNFTGQWLQARDIETVAIESLEIHLREHPNPEFEAARAVFRSFQGRPPDTLTPEEQERFRAAREAARAVFRAPRPNLTEELRRAMRAETELTFQHIFREDRSVLELLKSDYTFLNEDLAKHYGIEGVTGREMRKVTLPADSYRGGVLTQGTVLAVTSNPGRTSPVKRGVFILDAILGTPPPPPPPNIPSLESVTSPEEFRKLSARDAIKLHAQKAVCASCHLRMDPLGLALENFNAMGAWRTTDLNLPIDPAGELISGEKFSDIRELKTVLSTARRRDFYYALSEKLLTYALGRGVEYHDTTTLDQLVETLESTGGSPRALLRAIVTSVPFQQTRPAVPLERHAQAAASHGPIPSRLAP